MYSTCIHCNHALGANESIESFPIGRRLAFDAVHGRLWAVCQACERWNLSPIEERWEAIEECERAFRDTRVRTSTDNIGLARLRDGTELVRIGAPQRPEFAAWRYGDQFGRRRKKLLTYGAVGVAGAGALIGGGIALGVSLVAIAPAVHAINLINLARIADTASRTRIALPDGTKIRPFGSPRLQRRSDVPEGWGIAIGYAEREAGLADLRPRATAWDALRRWQTSTNKMSMGDVLLRGNDADAVMRWALPRVNSRGASRRIVADGVGLIETAGTAEGLGAWAVTQLPKWNGAMTFGDNGDMSQIPAAARLAFEMALHEESERQAMAGELTKLEEAWREADAIAKIADTLLQPAALGERIESMRRGKP